MKRTTAGSYLTSPLTLAKLKEIGQQLREKDKDIEVREMIAKLNAHQRSSTNDIQQKFSKAPMVLDGQSNCKKPAM